MLFFLAYLVDAALLIQNIGEKREHQCGEDVVYLKTGTKPLKQNVYYHIFYRDIYHCCTRVSYKRVACLESHLKLM